jgi:hypothetical protein
MHNYFLLFFSFHNSEIRQAHPSIADRIVLRDSLYDNYVHFHVLQRGCFFRVSGQWLRGVNAIISPPFSN